MKHRVSSGSPYENEFGFCRAVRADRRILVSGTAPLDSVGVSVPLDDLEGQTRRCLEIIVGAVQSLGGRTVDIVRTRIYLTRRLDWESVARVHGEFFGLVRPAATCVVVSELLRPEWRVEIEAEAVIGNDLRIDPCLAADRPWVEERCQHLFHGSVVVSWGIAHEPARLPGLIARAGGERVGWAAYNVEEENCELVTLEAVQAGQGVGSALLSAVEDAAVAAGCGRLWLITTNDNLDALRFYQRRGLSLAALHPRALELSRVMKPTIPLTGNFGIPLRDELVLEKALV